MTSPFHNTLELLRVGLLDDQAIELLLESGKQILLAEDLSALREWAGCHPYFLQLYGHELCDARLHQTSVNDAFDRFYSAAAGRFRELWKTLSPSDQEDLRKLTSNIAVTRRSLNHRGLVTRDGKPFGRILLEWLVEERV